MRNVVIVSPYFPPSNLAGVHRARHIAKYLPESGWSPTVLCVDEAYHEERLDKALAGLVPDTVDIVKVAAIPAEFTRPFGVGEISLRAFIPLRRRLLQLLATGRMDCVMITGSPYYPMLLSGEVSRKFGVPVVLDFQDPWVSAWGAQQRVLTKAGLSHLLATRLEPRALRHASFVTSVSAAQNAQMAGRYQWLDAASMAAIPIGSDPEDFAALACPDSGPPASCRESGFFNLSYVGTIWPAVLPTLRALLRAVARMRVSQPDIYSRLRLNFVGTTANPDDESGYRVLPMAAEEGVAELIREVPQRLPYLEALAVLNSADGGLMLGSDEPHYTASKIYPYLMSGRPYFSLFHRASSAHEILLAAGGGISLCFDDAQALAGLEPAICDSLCRLVVSSDSFEPPDPDAYSPYHARNIAKQFSDIFDKLSVSRGQP